MSERDRNRIAELEKQLEESRRVSKRVMAREAFAMQFGAKLVEDNTSLEREVHDWHLAELGCPAGYGNPCRFCEEPI